jgi:hypothetical protein
MKWGLALAPLLVVVSSGVCRDPELLVLLGKYADLLVKLHENAKPSGVHALMDLISKARQDDQK